MDRTTGVKAQGRIVSWDGASLWVLSAGDDGREYPPTTPHAHHAVQVTIALRGQFTLTAGREVLRGATRGIVAADARHTFDQRTGTVAHFFVAPESRAGRSIARELGPRQLAPIPAARLGDWPRQLDAALARRSEAALVETGRALIEALSQQPPANAIDPRIERAMSWVRGALELPVTLDEAAHEAELSAGRFRHLFVENVGVPFRVWVLWLRLSHAVHAFAGGLDLTHAAHAAGFADSAHLSRTFRRMFGITAASLRVE
ncbi:MAG: AraC family transcriptional regulator [Myxococcaceae bacterium]